MSSLTSSSPTAGGSPPPAADDPTSSLLTWLTASGCTSSVIFPSYLPHRTSLASSPIASDAPILKVPFKCMICPPNCLRSPKDQLGITLKDMWVTGQLRGDTLLAFLISREVILGADSDFEPYIRFLREIEEPETIEVWEDEELEELKDEVIVKRSRLRLREQSGMHKRVLAQLSSHTPSLSLSPLTLDLHLWSWRILQSRAFGRRLPWTSLVPLADCLNHSNVCVRYKLEKDNEIVNPYEKFTHDPESGDFIMYPSKGNSYAEGEEVFNSYGRRSNSHLMLDYGFCLTDNEWESVTFVQRLYRPQEVTELYGKLKACLNRAGFNVVRNLKLNRTTFQKGLMFCRIVNLTEEEADELIKGGDGDGIEKCGTQKIECDVISKSNEVKALHAMLALLNTFDTSALEEDEKLLESEEVEGRLRAAIIYRTERMRIVKRAVDMCEEMLQRIESM